MHNSEITYETAGQSTDVNVLAEYVLEGIADNSSSNSAKLSDWLNVDRMDLSDAVDCYLSHNEVVMEDAEMARKVEERTRLLLKGGDEIWRVVFKAEAESRETSPEIMQAIAKLANDYYEAKAIWEGPGDYELKAITDDVCSGGCEASEFCWGEAGHNWADE